MNNRLSGHALVRRHTATESAAVSEMDQGLSRVNDQFFFGEELERTITFHIHGVAVVAVRGREDRNDDAGLMVVVRLFNAFANRKFRHLYSSDSEVLVSTRTCSDTDRNLK